MFRSSFVHEYYDTHYNVYHHRDTVLVHKRQLSHDNHRINKDNNNLELKVYTIIVYNKQNISLIYAYEYISIYYVTRSQKQGLSWGGSPTYLLYRRRYQMILQYRPKDIGTTLSIKTRQVVTLKTHRLESTEFQ